MSNRLTRLIAKLLPVFVISLFVFPGATIAQSIPDFVPTLTPQDIRDIGDGVAAPQMVGGGPAGVGWNSVVRIKTSSSFLGLRQGICTGSLVSDRWVLTAAHCVQKNGQTVDVGSVTVYINERNITDAREDQLVGFDVDQIVARTSHPRNTNDPDDIALLYLDRSTTAPSVRLINPDFTINASFAATYLGWGLVDNTNIANQLRKAVTDFREEQNMFYAETPDNTLCGGDSGGPMFIDSGGWLQIGVNQAFTIGSAGECANTNNGWHVDLRRHIVWINAVLTSECNRHDVDSNRNNDVRLYRETNCSSSGFDAPLGRTNLNTITQFLLNNQTRSIKVKPGLSVRIYANADLSGASRCISGGMWDLSQDRYEDNTPINPGEESGISAIWVHENTNCGQGGPICGPAVANLLGIAASADNSCQSVPPTSPNGCPAGENGWYCGGTSLVGGAAGTLYRCDNGAFSVANVCSNGCIQERQGVADHCAPEGVDFCKTVTWGGAGKYCNGDKLVTCSPQKTTTSTVQCQFGCQQNALFTPDSCRTSDSGNSYNNGTVKFYGDSGDNPAPNSFRLEVGLGKSNQPSNSAQYKSFQMPSGWSMKTYSQDDLGGDQRCWSSSQPLLESEGWHNKIESVEVFDHNVCSTESNEGPYWDAYYYDGNSKWWDPDIPTHTARCRDRVSGEMLDKDFGSNSPCGGGTSSDNWVGEFVATRYFPAGDYVFNLDGDDGVQIFINGRDRHIMASQGTQAKCPAMRLEGNVTLKFMLREDAGDAHIKVTWSTDNSACRDVIAPRGAMTLPGVNTFNNGVEPLALGATAVDLEAGLTSSFGSTQDVSGVDRIDFYARSNVWNNDSWTYVGTATTAPYRFDMPTADKPEGMYFFAAKISDNEGNTSELLDQQHWTYATIDRTKPTSQMLPISEPTGYQFNVSWSGSDNQALDGQINYDIQYQLECAGEWQDWIGFRSGNTATFIGRPGESYCFHSRAIDLAGNISDWSASSNIVSLPACAENELVAEYYDDKNLEGNLVKTACEASINHDWGDSTAAFNVDMNSQFGDGADGDLVLFSNTVDNPIDAVANGAQGSFTINAANANFRAGQKILVYQVKGTNAGTYQITKIRKYDPSGVITTTDRLKTTYASGGFNAAQVMVIRQYNNVEIHNSFRPKEWDGATGGVLMFYAKGQVKAIGGWFDATGAGFRGGRAGQNPNYRLPFQNVIGEQGENSTGMQFRSIQAVGNGGGGGKVRINNDAGNAGGGGSNGTAGQEGNKDFNGDFASVGQGAPSIGTVDMRTQIFLGGGGGGGGYGDADAQPVTEYGNGGDGGGIIFIMGNEIDIQSTNYRTMSQGIRGQPGRLDQAAGGNGAGGSIKFIGNKVSIGEGRVDASGSQDIQTGTASNGGKGGMGRIRVEYYDSFSGSGQNAVFSVEKLSDGIDNFSVRWSGKLALTPGAYRFNSYQDDGFRLWVGNSQLINEWEVGYSENSATAVVGSQVDIMAEYFEDLGNASVKLNVIPGENRPPVVLPIPSQEIPTDETFVDIDLNQYGSDPDGDYTYWTASGGENVRVFIDIYNVAHITKPSRWIGNEHITFALHDEWDQRAYTGANFIATEVVNAPPILDPIPPQTIDEDNTFAPIRFDDYGHDPDGDPVTIVVRGNVNIAGHYNASTRVLTLVPAANWYGSETINFRINDGYEFGNDFDVVFTVNPVNDAPVITSSPVSSVDQNQAYSYQVTATDVDSGNLTYELTAAPAGMTISTTGLITWTANVNTSPVAVGIRVSDGIAAATQNYNLTVVITTPPPVVITQRDEWFIRQLKRLLTTLQGYSDTTIDPTAKAELLQLGNAVLAKAEAGLLTRPEALAKEDEAIVMINNFVAAGKFNRRTAQRFYEQMDAIDSTGLPEVLRTR